MFLVLILIMLVMVAVTIMLPQFTGLAKYKKNPDYLAKKNEKLKDKELKAMKNQYNNNNNTYTYQAPDAELEGDDIIESKSSAFSGVRSRLHNLHTPNITESDIPIKLELVGESELKRRMGANKSVGRITNNLVKADPTSFDYDVDEFIDEENRKDREEEALKYGSADV